MLNELAETYVTEPTDSGLWEACAVILAEIDPETSWGGNDDKRRLYAPDA